VNRKDGAAVNKRAFGKRVSAVRAQPAAAARPVEVEAVSEEVADFLFDQTAPDEQGLSVEEEILEWKRSRRHGILRAWPQIALTASVCFGTASFVLPTVINDLVQWPLYLLSATSLLAGLAGWRKVRS
jgi:hypothetical protein